MADTMRRGNPTPRHTSPTTVDPEIARAVAAFGMVVHEKLGRGGEPEDQLRAPVEALLRRLATHMGFRAIPYGEVRLKELRARPGLDPV
jgi:hypothetical protein